ncbi:hypothetical protein Vadar_014090 [Vaccinium darrowii]|uniref:Uncharacterized protein n=1 Tax=Vaccinium darrowii TaxID=229202 RepID=A0ACB7XQK2_9ERIC|nr:hypothetical protein Vadar_014090 [Vaccinium darrowii]
MCCCLLNHAKNVPSTPLPLPPGRPVPSRAAGPCYLIPLPYLPGPPLKRAPKEGSLAASHWPLGEHFKPVMKNGTRQTHIDLRIALDKAKNPQQRRDPTTLSLSLLRGSESNSMGMEVTDICMDKESDCVTVYSTVVAHDSEHETAPSDLDVTQSYDHNNGDPVQQLLEANAEVKECEVKECTAEKSIKISELSEAGKCEEVVPPPSCKESLPDEKMKLENQTRKDDNKKSKSSAKPKSRTGCGNARTNCTVPQPFALATEKRASCATRPTGIEPDAETAVSKSSNVNSLQHQHLINKNQKQMVSPLVSRKPLQPDNKKHPDEEDSYSVNSSYPVIGSI